MAFKDFAYPDVLDQFGLTFATAADLFAGVPAVPLSPGLQLTLPVTVRLATVGAEKARSEWIIAPILADLWGRYGGQIGLYSGLTFNADPDAGLAGFCDFLVSRSPQQVVVTPPVLVVVEAKQENFPAGLGQCVAGMVGAQRYNARKGQPTDPVYGCVTTGTAWRFLRLSGSTLTLDLVEYTIGQPDRILGVLIHMVGPPPA